MVLLRVPMASMASAAGIVVQNAEDWAASSMDAFSLRLYQSEKSRFARAGVRVRSSEVSAPELS